MSLDLDQRQRAMLQEMGVRVWLPEAVADVGLAAEVAGSEEETETETAAAIAIEIIAIEAINTGATASKAPDSRVPDRREPAPPVAPAGLSDGIAGMDWPTLAQTVANCQACALRTGRRAPVFGAADAEAPRQADWLVVGEPPDEAEERQGAPFADQAGQLLDNMLKALGVSRRGGTASRASAAYVTNVVKCRPAVVRNPDAQELAACENYLRREVALVQPKVILAMGRFAAQALLQGSLPEVASIPLGKLRGQIYRYHGIPVVVSYHPGYLLRTQQDKARAWADLCLALELTQ
ncbi:MAG: uracil-DNA glycosylase [Rhodoferax sp.]|uniref:uracil-DNA glycosylase n=1 Tax=Rhodoferax sp. TaxID=50421 RepID=UPI002722F981|nr:uracil-DNA glycosylase [Rhodoferax sp.]MDO8447226.1 uracil-DNA glycosylase [Rhodoferax sp.]